jgi:hypothetical protein
VPSEEIEIRQGFGFVHRLAFQDAAKIGLETFIGALISSSQDLTTWGIQGGVRGPQAARSAWTRRTWQALAILWSPWLRHEKSGPVIYQRHR